jgi:hypothetical protein
VDRLIHQPFAYLHLPQFLFQQSTGLRTAEGTDVELEQLGACIAVGFYGTVIEGYGRDTCKKRSQRCGLLLFSDTLDDCSNYRPAHSPF